MCDKDRWAELVASSLHRGTACSGGRRVVELVGSVHSRTACGGGRPAEGLATEDTHRLLH